MVFKQKEKPLGTNHHMQIRWHQIVSEQRDVRASQADLYVKATLIARIGALFLRSGAGGWRVRDAINRVSTVLGVTSAVSVGLTDIEVSVYDGNLQHSQNVVIPESGVNTNMIIDLDKFLLKVDEAGAEMTIGEYHDKMDEVKHKKALYTPAQSGLASAFACGAFTFLLGGGLIEMFCAFLGAGFGQFTRRVVLSNKINQHLAVGAGVAVSCSVYVLALFLLSFIIPEAASHEMGYIGAMLFVIPGFPLITAALDMFLFDMRSGIERLTYALLTIVIATLIGWVLAVLFQLKPAEFSELYINEGLLCALRFVAAFVGVFGFSIMFNSPIKVALTAGVMGGISDTVNLELVKFFGVAPEIGAFTGALIAGLLASAVWKATRYPRTAITVPSIVIMIPGLYLYKAMFYMASFDTGEATMWFVRAVMVIVFLPFGLALARALTDPHWRHTS